MTTAENWNKKWRDLMNKWWTRDTDDIFCDCRHHIAAHEKKYCEWKDTCCCEEFVSINDSKKVE